MHDNSLRRRLEIYQKAVEMRMFQKELEQIIPIVLAKASFDRRAIEAETDAEAMINLIQTLEEGIQWTRIGESLMRSCRFCRLSTP